MTVLALLRHAPSLWNEAGLLQGQRENPLSPAGARLARDWRVPARLAGFDWVTSPLERARATACLLGRAEARAEPRLIEMDWGLWSGRRLAELRRELGDRLAANEARGLDFRPDGGESPREVQARLASWFAEVAAVGRPVAAVTHRGVLRAALGLATGWDFLGPEPVRLRRDSVLMLELAPGGRARLAEPPVLSLEVER